MQRISEVDALATCRVNWPWKSGNGGFPHLPVFPVGLVEMTSSPFVEIRHSAISTCPPFPPPKEDRLAPHMVGRPKP
jgi:hypothetical protein